MDKKVCIKYPCGKLFELRIPIVITEDKKTIHILPGSEKYFEYAKQKFQINDLKVIEIEVPKQLSREKSDFISLLKK